MPFSSSSRSFINGDIKKKRRPSEISIEKDDENAEYTTCVVTIDNKFFITTTIVDAYFKDEIRKWIREIKRIYCKKSKGDLVVAISAVNICKDVSERNKHGVYDLMQFCVGSYCLVMLMDIEKGSTYTRLPSPMTDFLCHSRTVVVGVGIDKIVDKLEKDCNMAISKRIELRKEVEKKVPLSNFGKHSVIGLADEVLEGEIVYEKPNTIEPFDSRHNCLSPDIIQHATVEAFLVYSMASKLLKMDSK